jgi:hypothetical protein
MKGQAGALASFGRGRKRHRTKLQDFRLDAVIDELVVL